MHSPEARRGHRALRTERISEPFHIYHVTATTAARAALFTDLSIGRIAARCLNAPELLEDARTLCWVLMPDHLDWLVQIGERQSLSDLVRRLKTVSARQVNLRLNRAGMPVWAPSFYDRALRAEDDVETVARYIVANPVRAGLVDDVSAYSHWDAAWEWEWW
jgi:REP element-mobilizing transposase RayT